MPEDQPGLDAVVKAELDYLDERLEEIAQDMLAEDYPAAQTLLGVAEQAWRDREYDLAADLFAQIREHIRSRNHVLIGQPPSAPPRAAGSAAPVAHQAAHRRPRPPTRSVRSRSVVQASVIAFWWFGAPAAAFWYVRAAVMHQEAILAARCGSTAYCQELYVNGARNQWVVPIVIALCAIGMAAACLYIVAGIKKAGRQLRR